MIIISNMYLFYTMLRILKIDMVYLQYITYLAFPLSSRLQNTPIDEPCKIWYNTPRMDKIGKAR